MNPPPLLLVLSGPSGVGKDAVVAALRSHYPALKRVVTATTRPPRPGEVDGVDYLFLTPERFSELKEKGELLEYAQVYGYWYGVPRSSVRAALDRGEDVLLKVDVQGAATLRRLVSGAVFIFLAPPGLSDLVERLQRRRTESPGDMELRLKQAEAELTQLSGFDYLVVNDQIEKAAERILAIITAEKCRATPRKVQA